MAHDYAPPSIGSDFHNLRTPPIPSFLEMDPSMDHFHFTDQLNNPTPTTTILDASSVILPSTLNFQNHPMIFPEFAGSLADTFPGIVFHPAGEQVPGLAPHTVPAMGNDQLCESRKRKAADASESSSGVSSHSPPASGLGAKRKTGSGRSKRMKNSEKVEEHQEEKRKEVVHVRARRGQATDSHSLAERVRRGKINERLRCLQDIVPGCYKTMGLAVMLDEIINYVQSLQNQVEFLSMKLTAASSFYDFNSESDAIDKMQRAMAGEAKELQRMAREGSNGSGHQSNNFHSTSSPWHP
ncbi:transcription factor BEE 1 [Punica granatum]|uniref:Transcription factor BEE 1 n=1 Tax=Punica granatum TaxID=22663 RepID=A0A218XDJ8_PUNGR|nr:transcription factor BEE 1 [Punica granatum]OWM83013.1 hypothetical protein CDL15_Pgr005413 [Punica granatum]